jgi:hypothetical protein
MIQREKKTFQLSDGRKIEVHEASWDIAAARSAQEEQARAKRLKLNGSGDSYSLYFEENFYSILSSHSTGEIPLLEEAIGLPAEDVDGWFLEIVRVNKESFIEADREAEGRAEFRDGTIFRIVSAYRPSVTMRRFKLEEEALSKEEDRDHPKDVFSVYLYPILASCSIGEIPSSSDVRDWPESEIYKWRDAVKAINPQWFGDPGTIQTAESNEKKSGRSRKRSLGS